MIQRNYLLHTIEFNAKSTKILFVDSAVDFEETINRQRRRLLICFFYLAEANIVTLGRQLVVAEGSWSGATACVIAACHFFVPVEGWWFKCHSMQSHVSSAFNPAEQSWICQLHKSPAAVRPQQMAHFINKKTNKTFLKKTRMSLLRRSSRHNIVLLISLWMLACHLTSDDFPPKKGLPGYCNSVAIHTAVAYEC